ncbi:chorismate-binding protein, partial [Escherichia coli]|uniref:chorismate-binding protein n=1 Tax=Escherichia coli TaxID=562 RepID=UPI0015C363FD
FPGGSITVAPKVRAMEILDALEPHRRTAWSGSIGYLSFCGNMDTCITIRTLTAIHGPLYCSAGAGLVADSQEQAASQETVDKVNKLLPQLDTYNVEYT